MVASTLIWHPHKQVGCKQTLHRAIEQCISVTHYTQKIYIGYTFKLKALCTQCTHLSDDKTHNIELSSQELATYASCM